MTTSNNPPYKVGFGRPPVESQFKPGRSGNPSGRPTRRRSLKSDILAALGAPTANANGETTKQERLARDLVNNALDGESLAIKIVTQIALELHDNQDERENQLTPEDQSLIEDFNREEEPTDPTTTSPEDLEHE
jgi:hypothetical protein